MTPLRVAGWLLLASAGAALVAHWVIGASCAGIGCGAAGGARMLLVLLLAAVGATLLWLGRRPTRVRAVVGCALVAAWLAGAPIAYVSLLGREDFEAPAQAALAALVGGWAIAPAYGAAQAALWLAVVGIGVLVGVRQRAA